MLYWLQKYKPIFYWDSLINIQDKPSQRNKVLTVLKFFKRTHYKIKWLLRGNHYQLKMFLKFWTICLRNFCLTIAVNIVSTILETGNCSHNFHIIIFLWPFFEDFLEFLKWMHPNFFYKIQKKWFPVLHA